MAVEKGRYRKISIRMWGDDKFCALSKAPPNGQTLWIYLLTGPHTTAVPGLFSIGEAGLAEGIGWGLKAFREVFREVSGKGLAFAHWPSRVVFIPNAVKHNRPENPNVVISWRSAFEEIPDCALKTAAYQAIKGFLEGFGKGFAEAWLPEYHKVFPEQEQEQIQIQEQEQRPRRDNGASYSDERLRISDWLDRDLARMHPTYDRMGFYQRLSERLGDEPQDQSDSRVFAAWVKQEFCRDAKIPPPEVQAQKALSVRRLDPAALSRSRLQALAQQWFVKHRCVHDPACESRGHCLDRLMAEFKSGERQAS